MIDDMLSDLQQAGARQQLPDRRPGQYTLRELAAQGGYSRDNKEFRSIVDGLVASGKWRRLEAVVRDNGKVYHTWVYEKVAE